MGGLQVFALGLAINGQKSVLQVWMGECVREVKGLMQHKHVCTDASSGMHKRMQATLLPACHATCRRREPMPPASRPSLRSL